ncbi:MULTISPECIES: HNH endonuclease [unclassified Streptomyces]|uniref:HNH endonuclease n=1 Tax=unclassified Streptomyces TaxID=2593676 RepID=UPI0013711C97|nr:MULTISPECIES: HNH endonuclease [unclassified Streptomyces]NDZ98496.1 HNH endonuclease [Streptomyces sp. SID10116]MYY79777.1 HNH endonuclease [Streptomyces sp. SID335]MYZ16519.1 HNH endonuclease [Streptomyces sp. SID337]NDZ84486.1 HNH endonuclease [Streptomyces sp. SID10115]NEB43449.1 HNH endonuclease [Streptomyces sp. SID339]
MSGGWKGSTRRQRLPSNWASKIRPAAHARNPEHICHLCGQPGGDYLDHKKPGDDHSPDNLDWAHDRVPPHCHRYKSSREGLAARPRRNRTPEAHPGLL